MNLTTFWKKPTRYTYRVILKSGVEFRVSTTNLKIKWEEETSNLISYSFEDAKGEVPFHCVVSEIAAIIKVQ